MGYSSLYIIQNFGTLCWTLFIMPIIYVSTPIVVVICKRDFGNIKKRSEQMMFWGYWFEFLHETYLFLAVCVCLNLCHRSWASFGEGINTFISYFFGFLLAVLPIFTAIYYSIPQNFKKIKSGD